MGLTRENFSRVVKGMKKIWDKPGFIDDKTAFDLWYTLLSDYEDEVVNAAVEKYMMISRFPPTPADIRECAAEIVRPLQEEMTQEEAWNITLKAIRNSGYYSVEEFEKLPQVLQKVVSSPDHLKQMALMNSDELHTVEKSHFMKVFRTVIERRNNDERISPHLREIIASIKPKEIGSNNERSLLEAVE